MAKKWDNGAFLYGLNNWNTVCYIYLTMRKKWTLLIVAKHTLNVILCSISRPLLFTQRMGNELCKYLIHNDVLFFGCCDHPLFCLMWFF